MATGDGFVQVAPDSTGKKIDNSELTVNALLVERQRIVISDPVNATGLGPVDAQYGQGVQDRINADLLRNILVELRVLNANIREGLLPTVQDPLDSLRNEELLSIS